MDVTFIILSTLIFSWIFICEAELQHMCQGLSDSMSLFCNQGEYITIERIGQHKLRGAICEVLERENCTADFSSVKTKCNGQQNCKIEENDVMPYICYTYPRYSSVHYKCRGRYRYNYYMYFMYKENAICYPTLHLNCMSGYVISYVNPLTSKTVTFQQCDRSWSVIDTCLVSGLRTMCHDNQHCDITKQHDDWCFYLPFAVFVDYTCGNGSTIGTVNNHQSTVYAEPTMQSFDLQINSTIPYKNDGDEHDETVQLLLGKDNRLLVSIHNTNETFSLCLYNWGDTAAGVVCRQLNMSLTGKAGYISRDFSLKRLSFEIICIGNESSLEYCDINNSTLLQSECTPLGDATVSCYDELYKDEARHEREQLSITGLLVGTVVGGLLLILTCVISLTVWKRRCKTASPKSRQLQSQVVYEQNGGYLHFDEDLDIKTKTPRNPPVDINGSQDIAYQVLDHTVTGYKGGKQSRPDQSSTCPESEAHYAASTDGVYDISNDRRHSANDGGHIYNHTVDGVYDISGPQLNKDDQNNGNIYSHSVDSVYDTSSHFQEQSGEGYNTYYHLER